MTELSPAAQAVLDAFDAKQDEMHEVTWLTRNPDRDCLAAALRAAADHDPDGNTSDEYDAGWRAAMDFVEGIAAELEAQ